MQSSNGEHAPQQDKRLLPKGDQRRYTAETVRRTRPKTYRKAVRLLADPTWSVLQISKTLRLSEHTVRAIRQREAQGIAERKKTLAVMLANVAELGAGRMEETIGKASLRDAAIGTGIAVGQDARVDRTDASVADRVHRAAERRAGPAARSVTRQAGRDSPQPQGVLAKRKHRAALGTLTRSGGLPASFSRLSSSLLPGEEPIFSPAGIRRLKVLGK
jgi:hypothetical protein